MCRIVFFAAALLWFPGCSNSGSDSDTDTGDTGSEDSGTEDTEDTDSETDTGEGEIPPSLPVDCSRLMDQRALSDTGDARNPSLAYDGTSVLSAWGWDSRETDVATWSIQMASWSNDSGFGDLVAPMSEAVISVEPFVAAGNGGIGAVWNEGRTEWDASCLSDAPEDCEQSVVFMTFDSTGVPADAMPVRITEPLPMAGPPVLRPIGAGWLVFWQESDRSSKSAIWSVFVSSDGEAGAPLQVSDGFTANGPAFLSAGVSGSRAVVAWLSSNQQSVRYQVLDDAGGLVGSEQILEEGMPMFAPVVHGDPDGFLVSYSRRPYDDFEVFTRRLDTAGVPTGDLHRITWTTGDVLRSGLSFDPAAGYAVTWLSSRANGESDCVDDVCSAKVFSGKLNGDGSLAAAPVLLSAGNEDPNPAGNPVISFDGVNWLVIWEVRRDFRQQIVSGAMACETNN